MDTPNQVLWAVKVWLPNARRAYLLAPRSALTTKRVHACRFPDRIAAHAVASEIMTLNVGYRAEATPWRH